MFSRRTGWDLSPNRLSTIIESRVKTGFRILDLTAGNPTRCGFSYPEKEILSSISGRSCLTYTPDPRGLPRAREAIAALYRESLPSLEDRDIFLTASTSESYSLLFKLLCDTGDTVLFPRPSYPLFEYLALVNDIRPAYYRLSPEGGWTIDGASLRGAAGEMGGGRLGAIVLVSPHNPTGKYVDSASFDDAAALAGAHGAALIIDEVFHDYPLSDGPPPERPHGRHAGILTFTLNGLSKTAGLPQMKLGWIAVTGNREDLHAASERLEVLADTFLSVNTPVQAALPELLALAPGIREQIKARIRKNLSILRHAYPSRNGAGVLPFEGGWYVVLRLPDGRTDEECATGVLEERGVSLFPGYFFDFDDENAVVVSLLPPEEVFREGVESLVEYLGEWLKEPGGR